MPCEVNVLDVATTSSTLCRPVPRRPTVSCSFVIRSIILPAATPSPQYCSSVLHGVYAVPQSAAARGATDAQGCAEYMKIDSSEGGLKSVKMTRNRWTTEEKARFVKAIEKLALYHETVSCDPASGRISESVNLAPGVTELISHIVGTRSTGQVCACVCLCVLV